MEDLTKARHLSPDEAQKLRREADDAFKKMKAIIKKRKTEVLADSPQNKQGGDYEAR